MTENKRFEVIFNGNNFRLKNNNNNELLKLSFVETVVDGQHQTMMNVILNLLLVIFAMNAKASKKSNICKK